MADRQSLTKSLEQRYESQRSGGAFDARTAGSSLVDDFNNDFADGFTKGGQNTKLPKKDSLLLKGLDTRKYSPNGRSPR